MEWVRQNVHPLGDRDFPVDHPKAADTPGNTNVLEWSAGVDPRNAHLEPFTGRTPEQAAGVAQMSAIASLAAAESPVLQPLNAMEVAEAMNVKRNAVGHDVLTADEYSEVMAELHRRPRPDVNPEQIREQIAAQHQALTLLLTRAYPRETALNMISLEGAESIIKRFSAEAKGA